MDSYNSPTTKPIFRATQVVWYLVSLLEILLVFRFVMKLMAANPQAGFSRFIYGFSAVFTTPFSAVFPKVVIEGSVFEWTTLLAMLVYFLVGLGIVKLFIMGKTVSTPEAAAKLNEEEEV